MSGLTFLVFCYVIACIIFKTTFVPELIDLIRTWRIWSRYQPRSADLYMGSLRQAQDPLLPARPHFRRDFLAALASRRPIAPIADKIAIAAEAFFDQELTAEPRQPSQNVLLADAQYRDQTLTSLNKRENFAANFSLFRDSLVRSFEALLAAFPAPAFSTVKRPLATVALVDAMPSIGPSIEAFVAPLWNRDNEEVGLFQQFISEAQKNTYAASGAAYPYVPRQIIEPHMFKGPSRDVLDAYLKNTPFHPIFETPVPFDFVDRLGEHGLVLAAPGWGKTQLLQNLILHLVEQPDPPSVIVLNSQGRMLSNIQNLGVFAPGQPLSDRLVIIDPEDEKASPALNPFALPKARLSGYSRNIREQLEAGTAETFQYMFSSLSNDLTAKMSVAFNYLLTLVLSTRAPSFEVFFRALQEKVDKEDWTKSEFADDIRRLDATAQGFFQTQYFSRSFTETRQQIGQRIYNVIRRPAFQRMFGAQDNKFDLFTLMNRGSVILVNTSKGLLGEEGSAFFGRWIVSSIMRAAYERVAVPNPRRTLVIIDEASDFCDQNFEKALSKLRQFQVGFVMAFQEAGQIPILRSVLSNTSVKLCGGLSANDARTLAADMRATPEFLLSMQHRKNVASDWATYVRGQTQNAIRLDIPFFAVERASKMTRDQHDTLIQRNRARYYTATASTAAVTITQPQADQGVTVHVPFGGSSYAVSIPAGARDGSTLRLRNAVPAGDLLVKIVVIPDPPSPPYHDQNSGASPTGMAPIGSPPSTSHAPSTAAPSATPAPSGSPFTTGSVDVSAAQAHEGAIVRTTLRGRVLDVQVPPGARDGHVVTLQDAVIGEVRITVRIMPGPKKPRRDKKRPDRDEKHGDPSSTW